MEELEKERLNNRINEVLFPHVRYRRKVDVDTLDEYYEASLEFSAISKLFNEDEYDYVIDYLGEKDVFVVGTSPVLFSDHENYRYRELYKKPELAESIDDEQLKRLIKQYQDEKDPVKKQEYRNELLLRNMRLVKYMAAKYSMYTGIDINQLRSYGYEGVIEAIEKYDLDMGGKLFPTYVKSYILKGIPESCDFYHRNLYYQLRKVKKEIDEIYGKDNIPYPEVADDVLDMFLKQENSSSKSDKTISRKFYFNVPDRFDDLRDDASFTDNSELYKRTEDELFKKQMKKHLDEALGTLGEEERELLEKLFGLSGNQPMTFREAAKEYGVSRQTICNNSHKVLKKLATNKKLQSYRGLI